jgi:hypothetical protein
MMSLDVSGTDRQKMVIAARLERATYCLEGSCSIQLSYATNFQNRVFINKVIRLKLQ